MISVRRRIFADGTGLARTCAVVGVVICLSGRSTAAQPGPAFKSVSYDVSLTPDFTTGVVSGIERLQFQSLSDGLDAVSFTANPFAVSATVDGAH